MNSCLYRARVMHNRISPRKHSFHYNIFMFYIDLDELELLKNKFLLISRNRFNFFSYRDSEHLQLPAEHPDTTKTTKEHIVQYLKEQGLQYKGERIMLLTNL